MLSCWETSVFSCAGIEKVACLCKFDESDEDNLVQKYGVWLVMIEKTLGDQIWKIQKCYGYFYKFSSKIWLF